MGRKSDRREFALAAARYGYVYAGTTVRGHLRWRGPNGRITVTVSSFGNHRSFHNALAELRRNLPANAPEDKR